MEPIRGIHHITAAAKNPQTNVDFYHRVLGQRLVKTTVNFDDPGTYHLYYGDEVGTPGTIMTFFPWPNAGRGQRGAGEVAATAYAIPVGSASFWRDRLDEQGVFIEAVETRFGEAVWRFSDPEGTSLELVLTERLAPVQVWEDGPVPAEHAIRAFHSATIWIREQAATADLLTGALGFEYVGQEGERHRYSPAEGEGSHVDLVVRPELRRARFGAGSVHHIAFRTADDDEQLAYQQALRSAGQAVTPVKDRQYFHSIYFREPGGVLFEVATDAPGFPVDEPVDALGQSLKLPPMHEGARSRIESVLPRFTHPDTGAVIPGDAPADPHGNARIYMAGTPLGEAPGALILVHGRGASAASILELGPELKADNLTLLAPEAADHTWYPRSFLSPLEVNEPKLSSALGLLGKLVDGVIAEGVPAERIAFAGFSQGACLASEFIARNARRYAGLYAFSGGLIGPPGAPREYPGSLDGTPVFLGCSDSDAHVPVERVHETAEVLAGLGAEVTQRIYPGMGHTIVADEVAEARKLMAAAFG